MLGTHPALACCLSEWQYARFSLHRTAKATVKVTDANDAALATHSMPAATNAYPRITISHVSDEHLQACVQSVSIALPSRTATW